MAKASAQKTLDYHLTLSETLKFYEHDYVSEEVRVQKTKRNTLLSLPHVLHLIPK